MDFAAFPLCLEVSDAQQDKAWNQFFSLHFIPQVKMSLVLNFDNNISLCFSLPLNKQYLFSVTLSLAICQSCQHRNYVQHII